MSWSFLNNNINIHRVLEEQKQLYHNNMSLYRNRVAQRVLFRDNNSHITKGFRRAA